MGKAPIQHQRRDTPSKTQTPAESHRAREVDRDRAPTPGPEGLLVAGETGENTEINPDPTTKKARHTRGGEAGETASALPVHLNTGQLHFPSPALRRVFTPMVDDHPPVLHLPGPCTSWRAPSFRLETSPYSNEFFLDILEAIRHHPSFMQDNTVFLGVPWAELVPQDLIELLWEGHIWGPQLDFVGALINASSTRVWTFDS